MPEEPDIEKTLRAYAKRRRLEGGAPPELHPATRKLFHDQIARLNRVARPAAGFRLGWLWASPARLMLSFACVAALLVLGSILLPRLARGPDQSARAPIELAKANAPATETRQSSATTPQAEPLPSARAADGNVAPTGRSLVAPSPAPEAAAKDEGIAKAGALPAKSPAGSAADAGQARAQVEATGSVPPSTGAPTGAGQFPESPALAQAGQAAFPATHLTRRFNRVNASPPLDALTSSNGGSLFRSLRVEQDGTQLSVIDESDGSVYTGLLTNAAPAAGAPALTASGLLSEAAGTNLIPATNYSFSVSGTNRSLNQPVVLTGNVGPNFGAAAGRGGGRRGGTGLGGGGGGFGGGGGGGGGRAPDAGGAPAAPANSNGPFVAAGRGGRGSAAPAFQLRGTIIIGTNRIPISATPAAPN